MQQAQTQQTQNPHDVVSLVRRVSELEKRASQQEQQVVVRAHALIEAQTELESLRCGLLTRSLAMKNDHESAAVADQLTSIEITDADVSARYHRHLEQRLTLAAERLAACSASIHGIEAQEAALQTVVRPQLEDLQAELANVEERMRRAQAMPAGAERRQHQRVPVVADVSWESEDNFYTGFSTDISECGVFISTVELFDFGQQVALELSLPSGVRVAAEGVVRWIREWNDMTPTLHPGMGIQFTELSPDSREAISRFVNERDPLFFVD